MSDQGSIFREIWTFYFAAGYIYVQWFNGYTWWRKFKKRHQAEITLRKPDKLDRGRSRMANVNVMKQHFELLGKTLKDLKLMDKPDRIFNCDESGIAMDAKTGNVSKHLVLLI